MGWSDTRSQSMYGMKALLDAGYSSLNFSLYQAWVAKALEPRNTSEKEKNQRLAWLWTHAQ